jgi:predicted RNA methylase
MLAAISQADATVIASALALAGVVYAGWRANRTNRREHAVNTGKLDQLLDNQDSIKREVHFIRTDVTDIHGAITELRRADYDTDARVTRLERHQPEGNDAA